MYAFNSFIFLFVIVATWQFIDAIHATLTHNQDEDVKFSFSVIYNIIVPIIVGPIFIFIIANFMIIKLDSLDASHPIWSYGLLTYIFYMIGWFILLTIALFRKFSKGAKRIG